MSASITDLLPPTLRAQLAHLTLRARFPPPRGPLGQNTSRQRGQGLEFSQYRAYEPGDDPRHIDWKLFARADRHFVREADGEAALTLWIILDTTASMLQSDIATPTRDKATAARTLAAAAIDIATRQGDAIGLACIGGHGIDITTAARGARQRDRCLLALERAGNAGTWPSVATLRRLWETIPPAAVVLFLGDGFDTTAEQFAMQLAGSRRDVRCLALTSVDERDFALRGGYRFEDPETGAVLDADATHVRDDFRRRFANARTELAARLAGAGIVHVEHVLDASPLTALQRVLDPIRGAAR